MFYCGILSGDEGKQQNYKFVIIQNMLLNLMS